VFRILGTRRAFGRSKVYFACSPCRVKLCFMWSGVKNENSE
jgi:hypothetical protein